MTRDTHRLQGEQFQDDNVDAYAALWAVAPFPRVPENAPEELKKSAIEIDDPRRVYTIHQAARRHQFHILVERYIHQLKHGCQSPVCQTPTCFSCRKRLSAGAPIRRYNSTSARTLAIYLASQDNPEKGLCHHRSAESPSSESNKPLKSRPGCETTAKAPPTLPGVVRRTSSRDARIHVSVGSPSTATLDENPIKNARRKKSMDSYLNRRTEPDLSALEESTIVDHKSFVQNVFGTVAFRMVEWLTPRNLERLIKSQGGSPGSPKNVSNTKSPQFASTPVASPPSKGSKDEVQLQVQKETTAKDERSTSSEHLSNSENNSKVPSPSTPIKPSATPKATIPEMKPNSEPLPRISSENRHRRSYDLPGTRGILNKTSKLSESPPDVMPFPPQGFIPTPKQRLSRQSLITSPKMQISEIAPVLHEIKLPMGSVTEPSDSTEETEEGANIEDKTAQSSNSPKDELREEWSTTTLPREEPLPQSLPSMSIDMMEFLCDMVGIQAERHELTPRFISQRYWPALRLAPTKGLHFPILNDLARNNKQWQMFAEQVFFDVLSKPDSLIKSFRIDSAELFDTQTMWYLMLRMTRLAPSLVLDSLWNAAGALFRPPNKIEGVSDWVKHPEDEKLSVQQWISNRDAAQVINICLHALIAVLPLVTNTRQLANMSRIRSYGLAMLGKEAAFLEPLSLCLQYEDAFTNDLAVRLARRIFSAIPIRQRFTELLDLQKDIPRENNEGSDVLEILLGTLKYLDSGAPPTVKFSDQERDMHEKRIPTLLLDWARTIMLQDWEGSAEVPSDGAFGGALAMMAAIYKHRKSLLMGDIHFRTEYFADRLDSINMPLEWLNFSPNKRTVHLLEYPYLFNPATLITYFRAINYSRMNQSYEEAKATNGLMYSTAAENALMVDKNRRDRLHNRMRTATSRFLVLQIRRTDILLDTFNSIWRREERELMRPLKVRLGEDGGEEGLDSGGVQQEFFRLAIAEALDPDYGAFTIDVRTKMTWFQPGSPEPLWKLELIGTIVSLAVYNGLTLPVTFPKALYRKLLDEDVTELHHIADGWPDLTTGLTSLLEWDEKNGLVEDVFSRTYEFSVEQFGVPVSREMGKTDQWPQFSDSSTITNPTDARMVTRENCSDYVSDYIKWLTDISVRPQFEAFKKGFFTCVDRRSVTLFDSDTLQSIVEGVQHIDISEMRRATRYIGWDASHHSVRDFWSIVKRYDAVQKRKLLEFVTASDRVPVGGMRNLQFTLQRNGVGDGHLPSSYTCYGILLLPEYSSKDVLREKLAMALMNSKGFGFA